MATRPDHTRRDFVRAAGTVTAATAATVLGAPAIGKAQANGNPVRYGLIGTGARGCYLLRHMAPLANCRLKQ